MKWELRGVEGGGSETLDARRVAKLGVCLEWGGLSEPPTGLGLSIFSGWMSHPFSRSPDLVIMSSIQMTSGHGISNRRGFSSIVYVEELMEQREIPAAEMYMLQYLGNLPCTDPRGLFCPLFLRFYQM
jgi:hypothetical protein